MFKRGTGFSRVELGKKRNRQASEILFQGVWRTAILLFLNKSLLFCWLIMCLPLCGLLENLKLEIQTIQKVLFITFYTKNWYFQ